jgi:hypothetical protein
VVWMALVGAILAVVWRLFIILLLILYLSY